MAKKKEKWYIRLAAGNLKIILEEAVVKDSIPQTEEEKEKKVINFKNVRTVIKPAKMIRVGSTFQDYPNTFIKSEVVKMGMRIAPVYELTADEAETVYFNLVASKKDFEMFQIVNYSPK